MINMKPLIKIMIICTLVFNCFYSSSAVANTSALPYIVKDEININRIDNWKVYANSNYKITLEYPSEWKENKAFTNRYDGNDGFFQVVAISAENVSIDKVADEDAHHMAKPYGSNPQINNIKVQGQDGRLILPSADQGKEMSNQAGLIVKYPKPIKIGSRTYNYFVLYADKNHIEEIAKTIKFI